MKFYAPSGDERMLHVALIKLVRPLHHMMSETQEIHRARCIPALNTRRFSSLDLYDSHDLSVSQSPFPQQHEDTHSSSGVGTREKFDKEVKLVIVCASRCKLMEDGESGVVGRKIEDIVP